MHIVVLRGAFQNPGMGIVRKCNFGGVHIHHFLAPERKKKKITISNLIRSQISEFGLRKHQMLISVSFSIFSIRLGSVGGGGIEEEGRGS